MKTEIPETFHAWVVREASDGSFSRKLESCRMHDLPEGDVLIRVEYSSVNYKDVLSMSGNKGVTRQYPHTPGIDAAGVVVESKTSAFSSGTGVAVTGYDLGMNTHGGLGQFIRVPADWVVPLPAGLTARDAMVFGTAGFTAALSVRALRHGGATPEQGDVLVTGASGGVGCLAVFLLAKSGFRVVASSGKAEAHDMLSALGAAEIVARDAVLADRKRPLLKTRWAHVIDTVGGDFLESALRATAPNGVVTSCGMVASAELNTNVFPFILRGICLQGIDSATTRMTRRLETWEHLAAAASSDALAHLVTEVTLDEIETVIQSMGEGKSIGRTLVRIP
ncbi:MAG: YhdH/YhfP family quinone oxidoreductase [Kiritimatiellae bacterium]|nr:YhdH/YhfP family quinone oxidoreductase [Kiritimatiellia bacterium]